MSDPIDRMNQLRSDVEGGPMPPAAEVRRRGDRLRRRRTAAITAGAALAVVAIVTPVAVLATGGTTNDSPIDPAGPSESTSAPAVATTLTEENLLRDDDVAGAWGDGVDVTVGDTTDADAGVAPCGRGLGELGATQTLTRTFGFTAVEGGDGDADHHASETIASFADARAAEEAREQIKAWIDDCEPGGAEQYTAGAWTDVTVPVPGGAEVGGASYGPAEAEPGSQYDVAGRDDLGWVLTSGVVVSGNRIAVITDLTLVGGAGGDTGAAVRSLLPTAGERLVLEAGESQASTEWRTDIPAGFPVDRDLSAPEGDPISGPGPDATGINPLDICEGTGSVLDAQWTREPVERVAASAPGPEYLDARELITLPDEAEARGVLADLRFLVDDCADSGDGRVWTIHDGPDLGEESLFLSRTYDAGLGGDVYAFVRVGNAVVAVDRMGEWELSSTVPSGVAEVSDIAATIVPDMCIYAADGC